MSSARIAVSFSASIWRTRSYAADALGAVAAVVAVAAQHAAEWPLALLEVGPAAVVLEARDHARPAPEISH